VDAELPDNSEKPAMSPSPSDPAPTPPSRGGSRTLIVVVLFVLVAAAGGWYWYSRTGGDAAQSAGGATAPASGSGAPASGRRGGAAADASKPTPVATMPARSGDFDVYLNALGTVTARSTVTVHSRVDGQLIRVPFTEGQIVKAGELLAEIDPRPFQVTLEQANGQLAKDQALLANAQVDLERYKTLLSQDSIASQQVDTQASLVRQYQGAIATDKGQVDSAKLQLSFTRITAPIAGRLGLRQVDSGNMIHASDTNGLVVITQVQPIDVVFPIPETNLQRVLRRMRESEALIVDAYDRNQARKLASGKLLTTDNQIDTATGTIKLKAVFANENGTLFPNQFVNVRMLVDTLKGVTIVPSAAIQRGAPGSFVYVVKDDKTVTVKVVKVGPIEGENAVIDSGVSPGDVLVVDGTDRLREGAKVEPVTRNPAGAAEAAPKRQRPAGTGDGKGKGAGKGNASGG
jgi:membrane fusion protein, multidrug efflux system